MDILLCDRVNQQFNQYIEHLTAAYQKEGHNVILDVQNFLFSNFMPRFVHIQWPEAIYCWRCELPKNDYTLNFIKQRLDFYASNGIPIVYTVHNLSPHDGNCEFSKKIFETIITKAAIIVHHGKDSITKTLNNYPSTNKSVHIICPHGPYLYDPNDTFKSRIEYHLPAFSYVYLNFGIQKKYKGYNFSKKVFKRFKARHVFFFTIGKRIYKKNYGHLYRFKELATDFIETKLNLLNSTTRKTVFRLVSHNEISKILAASDVLFLGHQKGLNSGLLSLAASYGKPVVFPNIGNFKEQLNGWPWYESYEVANLDSALEALRRMHARIVLYPPGKIFFDNTEWLKYNSWEIHIKSIINAVEEWYSTSNKEKK